ncbi:MAG: peptidylprolyl isomerase [Acidimicrobiia bacterium]|nr:peptidylprolyl isomerase [Acidimicrobiia bacterium]
MKNRSLRLISLLLVSLFAVIASACGALDGYAAKVNGEVYTQAAFKADLKAQRDNKVFYDTVRKAAGATSSAGTISTQISNDWLTNVVYQIVLSQAAKEKKINLTDQDLSSVEAEFAQSTAGWSAFPKSFRSKIVKATALTRGLQANIVGERSPSEATVEAFYARNADRICPSQKVVLHVLVATQPEAVAVENSLKGGGDFAAIATAQSTDTGSAPAGGSLGCLAAGSFVPEFQNAADALAPGETSAPVQSQYGWHVIRVLPASYALLTDQVQQAYSQIAQSTFNTWFQKKLAKAVVKIDSLYGVWANGENGYAVSSKPAPKVRELPAKNSGSQGITGATGNSTP